MTDEVQKAPMKVITMQNYDMDILAQYFMGNLERHELSDPLKEYIDRMKVCHQLIEKWSSRTRVASILQKKYDISLATAHKLFERTEYIFGKSIQHSQALHADILLGDLRRLLNKAEAANDFKAAAMFTKQMAEIIEKHMGSAEALLYENFEMQPIVIGFFPEHFKVDLPEDLDAQLAKLKKAKSKKEFGEKVGQYVDYEKV